MPSSAARTIVWFRNDLRVRDNYVLQRAAENAARRGHKVIPVYCFDPDALSGDNRLEYGGSGLRWSPKLGRSRAQFLFQSVNRLKEDLQALGSDLCIRFGRPKDVIPSLLSTSGADEVLTQQQTTYEEQQAEHKVVSAISKSASLQTIWDCTLCARDSLPWLPDLSDAPTTFTAFLKRVEPSLQVPACLCPLKVGELPWPDGVDPGTPVTWRDITCLQPQHLQNPPEPHPSSVMSFEGGTAAGVRRLRHYLWDSDLVSSYFDTRNEMLGADYSTKLSPWLALGCVSARMVYNEVCKYEAERTANKSTYWVGWELLCRDFFRFMSIRHGSRLFLPGGALDRRLPWNGACEALCRWCDGQTGVPVVDANMRELVATGFMSNRGRQIVASYLIWELSVDWRLGAAWFEANLVDYDVASNWGNWMAAAGLVCGRIRRFNMERQSRTYDANGRYLRAWLPELQAVPDDIVHTPWKMAEDMQEKCGVVLGVAYPFPLEADHTVLTAAQAVQAQ